MSPDSGINELHGLTPEEQERQRQEWQQELTVVCLIKSGTKCSLFRLIRHPCGFLIIVCQKILGNPPTE
jgi:hypothetical protein